MNTQSQPLQKRLNILSSKLKRLREQYFELGYSQKQFQLHILTIIFGYKPLAGQDVTKCLTSKLGQVNSLGRVEEVLGVVDIQLQGMLLSRQGDDKVYGMDQSGQVLDDKNRELLAKKRKYSKQTKQNKKQKKIKAAKQATQNQPSSSSPNNPPQKNIFQLMMQAKNLLALQQTTSRMSSLLNITNNMYNQQDTKQEREKEILFQKIVQIQMLSKLLCGDGGAGLGAVMSS